MKDIISIDDFAKIDLKVGQILEVEKVPDTDKLLKLKVDMGTKTVTVGEGEEQKTEEQQDIRQIVSGIALFFEDIQILVGKKCMFVANLEPRTIRGLESEGMIVAVSTPEGKFSVLSPSEDIPVGTSAK
jgi:methionyl-tRNA synthetase